MFGHATGGKGVFGHATGGKVGLGGKGMGKGGFKRHRYVLGVMSLVGRRGRGKGKEG